MYQAIVTAVAVSKHPNADRLQLGTCANATVVLGMDTKDGDIGVYFPPDGRLSEEMLDANKLKREQGGYFEELGKVRAQKFRGVKSEGIWLPLSSLSWTGVDLTTLTVGSTVDTLNGKLVCEKFFTAATLAAMNRAANPSTKGKKGETPWFKKQPSTPQLTYVIQDIPDGSLIYFTEKLHGTSGRCALAQETKTSWWRRLLGLEQIKFRKLIGSKNVIISDKKGAGYYEDESFRFSVKNWNLHEGETVYYEIVGYLPEKRWEDEEGIGWSTPLIMPAVDNAKAKDPELIKKYGPAMVYAYGCKPGAHDIYVYRITRTNTEGVVTELSWPQVKGRCAELGVKHVPEVWDDHWCNNNDCVGLQELADMHLEGPSLIDPSHIREGIVLRIEQPNGRIWFAKHKSFTFKVLEGIIKDNPDYVDIEEVA